MGLSPLHASLVLTLSTIGFFFLDGWAGIVILFFLDKPVGSVGYTQPGADLLSSARFWLRACLGAPTSGNPRLELPSSDLGRPLWSATHWAMSDKTSWLLGQNVLRRAFTGGPSTRATYACPQPGRKYSLIRNTSATQKISLNNDTGLCSQDGVCVKGLFRNP